MGWLTVFEPEGFDIKPRADIRGETRSEREDGPTFRTPDHTATKTSLRDKLRRGGEDAPPTARKRTASRARKPAPKMPADLGKQVAELYALAGMMLAPFDMHCAGAVMESAERCGEAWEDLARHNEAVRRVLVSLVQGSDWSKVILANGPIISAIAIHHVPIVRKIAEERFAASVEDSLRNAQDGPQDGQNPNPSPESRPDGQEGDKAA